VSTKTPQAFPDQPAPPEQPAILDQPALPHHSARPGQPAFAERPAPPNHSARAGQPDLAEQPDPPKQGGVPHRGRFPGRGDGATLLAVQGLAVSYGELRVVRDVSLEVREGEVLALLGRNGAGKTTTLRAIAGLSRAAGGTVRFLGRDVTHAPAHRRVRMGMALVLENRRIFRRRTVHENLLLGGWPRTRRRAPLRDDLEQVYALFPVLASFRNVRAGSLSGGQQQMLAIGQALMARPRLLLLDEPSAGLAPAVVHELMSTVEQLARSGMGVLLVEQAVESAARLAARVVVIDIGRVVLEGRLADIGGLQAVRDAYFGRYRVLDSAYSPCPERPPG
jgi:branched-chain amino acid transport system ATP-binding protein